MSTILSLLISYVAGTIFGIAAGVYWSRGVLVKAKSAYDSAKAALLIANLVLERVQADLQSGQEDGSEHATGRTTLAQDTTKDRT